MSAVLAAALLAGTVIPTAHLPRSTNDPCAPWDGAQTQSDNSRRVTVEDLVTLGDIGRSDPNESEPPFGVSPDGKYIAFMLRRANAQENEFCQRLLVARMDGKGEAKEIDRGGDFIRADFPLRKFVSLKAGYAKVITPRWSPDGRTIAYLKKVGATSQVWLVQADRSRPPYSVTDMPDDIDNIAWTANNGAIVVATRPGIRLQAEAIAKESRTGFLFDHRFAPNKADRPGPVDPVQPAYTTIDLATGVSRQSTAEEIALLVPETAEAPGRARGFSISKAGHAAWRDPIFKERLISPAALVLRHANGVTKRCDEACSGVRQAWWSADGQTLYALQKTGWADSRTAVLRWPVKEKAPRQVMITDDALIGCDLANDRLVCAREGSIRPRRLVAIDPDTGAQQILFDPNPQFASITLGKAKRMHFRNAFGVESFADLVLPPGHKPGERHPLVLVQYHSHGFLRGGTADEFPIQLYAAKGFAVLSFARPDFVAKTMEAKTEVEMGRSNRTNWIDRRSVQSSMDIAIQQAVATGAIDPDRMGISGFSDGTSTTQWALINSSHFKVAALGACCEDAFAFPLAAGPDFARNSREYGYRFFEPGIEEFWKPMSLALNADNIDEPILIQTGDSEYEIGLDVVETFRHRGKAIELYVLEGEPHFKYQPSHRLAIYERSTEWFQFWLKNEMNCDPAKAEQYRRWKAMKGAPPEHQLRCDSLSLATP